MNTFEKFHHYLLFYKEGRNFDAREEKIMFHILKYYLLYNLSICSFIDAFEKSYYSYLYFKNLIRSTKKDQVFFYSCNLLSTELFDQNISLSKITMAIKMNVFCTSLLISEIK